MREKTRAAIFEHARKEYPLECCGVIAQKSRVEKYFPCRNINAFPGEQFELAPDDYADAEDWGAITAIVHSHCGDGVSAKPSELDSYQCDLHKVPWVIVSLPEGDLNIIQPRTQMALCGRPFLLGYADCWSLIRAWHAEQGITLKDYSVDYHWWEQGENKYMENYYAEGFREVNKMRPGDMIIMQIAADVPNHAGILLQDNQLLHHPYGRLSLREPFNDYYRERVVKIVRHKDLA